MSDDTRAEDHQEQAWGIMSDDTRAEDHQEQAWGIGIGPAIGECFSGLQDHGLFPG